MLHSISIYVKSSVHASTCTCFLCDKLFHALLFHCDYGLRVSVIDDGFHKKVLRAIKSWLVLILHLFRQIALLVGISRELTARKKIESTKTTLI